MSTKVDLRHLKLQLRVFSHREDGTPYYKGVFAPIRIDDADTQRLVCEVDHSNAYGHEPEDLDLAQAERIVAAVNAFIGIPLEKIAEYADQIANDQRKGRVDPHICYQCGTIKRKISKYEDIYLCTDCYCMYYFPGD